MWSRIQPQQINLIQWEGPELVGANGTSNSLRRTTEVTLEISELVFPMAIVVFDVLTVEAILGRDFLENNGCVIHVGQKLLSFSNSGISVPFSPPLSGAQHTTTAKVMLLETYSELEVMATTQPSAGKGTWILEGEPREKPAVMIARAVTTRNGELPVRLVNLGGEAITVYQESKVACIAPVEQDSGEETTSADKKIPANVQEFLSEAVGKCGHLRENERELLYTLLLAYSDIFAHSKTDFGQTSHIQH